MAKPSGRHMRDELVAAATSLIQRVGVTGFSYGDLAKELGIKAPSIHHHFRTKEDLTAAVAAAYRKTFAARVAQIGDGSAIERLTAYTNLFVETAERERLCLCGAVSADWLNVGELTRRQVNLFYAEQRSWLQDVLAEGVASGEVRSDVNSAELATAIYASLQGAMLMSRASGDPASSADTAGVLNILVEAP